jgi:hypothetical protein
VKNARFRRAHSYFTAKIAQFAHRLCVRVAGGVPLHLSPRYAANVPLAWASGIEAAEGPAHAFSW